MNGTIVCVTLGAMKDYQKYNADLQMAKQADKKPKDIKSLLRRIKNDDRSLNHSKFGSNHTQA